MSVAVNSKVLSLAKNLAVPDITYDQTNEIRIQPINDPQTWNEGDYNEWEVPASSTAHDVMSESYFDIEWEVKLNVAAGSQLYNYIDTAAPLNLRLTPSIVGADGISLPLPATSGFTPSQGFFHDLFSDLVTECRNSGDIRTISQTSGAFQWASKVLEVLDSQGPRFGTAHPGSAHSANMSRFANTNSLLSELNANTSTTSVSSDYVGIVGMSADQSFVIKGCQPNVQVSYDNEDPWHLSLTVGREYPDVYTLLDTAGQISQVGIMGNEPLTPATVSLNNELDKVFPQTSVPDPMSYQYYAQNPIPYQSLWALVGSSQASSVSQQSKPCALYRNRQIVGDIPYARSLFFSNSFDPAAVPATDALALASAYWSSIQPAGVAPAPYGNPVTKYTRSFRNAYRPKDGIFQIAYDWPAYAPKRFKLRRGPFAQAWVGNPLADLNEWLHLDTVGAQKHVNGVVPDVFQYDMLYNHVQSNANPYNELELLRQNGIFHGTSGTVSYVLNIKRMDLIMHRHKVDVESEAAIRRAIMEAGLAQYAVRRCDVQIRPIPVSSQYFDTVLYENTAADLILMAVVRNQALNFSQKIQNNRLATITKNKAVQNRNRFAKFVDSMACAPRIGLNEDVVNAKYSYPFGRPSVPLDELYLLVNGEKEPNLSYTPDTGTKVNVDIDSTSKNATPWVPANAYNVQVVQENDPLYLKFVKEINGAGYPESVQALTKNCYNSNIRLYAFNLTSSKFPIKDQGSNLANKKKISASLRFTYETPADANVGYSVVTLAITSQARLQMDSSGNHAFIY